MPVITLETPVHVGKPGTLDGYCNHGCRCDECKRLWREYNAERRAIRGVLAAKYLPPEMHGKYTTYHNWKCHCPACTAASVQWKREHGKRRLAEGRVTHGTVQAYNFGCRCELCKQARSKQSRRARLPDRIATARRRLAELEALNS